MTNRLSARTRYTAALLGLSAVALFCVALMIFGGLNPNFHYLHDYVSKLGAQGQPNAMWWNLIGFLTVGTTLAAFGWTYGRVVGDRLVGLLLSLFGVGFAITALPTEIGDAAAALSKAHTAAICLALAAWMFALARMAHLATLDKFVYYSANIAAFLTVLPIIGYGLELWSMPVTHRLVFAIVFGWVALASFRLMSDEVADSCDSPGYE